ncbi:MAG: preprotein translocase subunit SecA [Candidatus Blackburnbacteria bacterium RIFCSPHIGHO2_01_FULL_43_15b]|uniref:Protein translocase subunit SecA n=1 Tax=Candidatus Blackburnbacteria bacterium RIFCSPHIGHO2_01_FULL_43_15b TaxID=1797513 RepID=A0A1G1UZW1_9BACT|nr:MAG: preprotein translocase subunit SecA [Candidatus Blackburnbacteria bacterium RIFCSPHIGHO2_01_FULL_43_15b]
MLGNLFGFLDANKRDIDRFGELVAKINSLGPEVKKLKDQDFAKKTKEFRERVSKGETLEGILPEAFAVGREAVWRSLAKHPYDVQLVAGIALSEGRIAEQKTGEGKTLSAVLPLYLHSLTGKSTQLVTVNDYLARVGAGWNAPAFRLLGLSVGVIIQEGKSFVYDPEYLDDTHGDERLSHLKPVERKAAYDCDVLYGTNNEFGFDYLRDNMVSDISEMVQRGHYFAIVDEADSVLIDEARTPLIISAPDMEPTDKYYKFAQYIQVLNETNDYVVDEKLKTAILTEAGIAKIEKILGVDNLYEKDFDVIHHVENALRARTLYLKDRDYIVKDNQVIIVDEFTGRLMFGRRWSDGLHQAVEAKEGVTIQQESKTLATISFQNYFRMYKKLAGMTGTALTEAEEFHKIYSLEVLAIPTYRPVVRKDLPDVIYKTVDAKYEAIAQEVEAMSKSGRPVLIGTTSIEKNEILDKLLSKKKVKHNLLNAKNHEKEAFIIAEAGEPGAVTVATNMAGRGVDIILGGAQPDIPLSMDPDKYKNTKEYELWGEKHKKVVEAGGLHVIGTERHESRRIDNQLRGRAGRLGDPGSTRFYLSLEDDLMRIFGGERIASIMTTLQIPEDQPIENRLISRAIEQAQGKVESFHFDARKRVVEYDDVANQQREIIYKLRKQVLENKDLKERIREKLEEQIEGILTLTFDTGEEPDYQRLITNVVEIIPFDSASQEQLLQQVKLGKDKEDIRGLLLHLVEQSYATREKQLGRELMGQVERYAYLSSIDNLWVEHLTNLDDLREGVGLRSYGQKDPLVEFKNEAFQLFDKLMSDLEANMTKRIFRIVPAGVPVPTLDVSHATTNEDTTDEEGLIDTQPLSNLTETAVTRAAKALGGKKTGNGKSVLGRNDPCWCGKKDASGKSVKWKKCHYPQLPNKQ